MDKEEIRRVLDRYAAGIASDDDREFLESWYHQQQIPAGDDYLLEERLADAKLVWNRLSPAKPLVRTRLWPRIAVAASVLLAFTAGLYHFVGKPGRVDDIVFSSAIQPGGHHAFLTLSNGEKIVLDDKSKGKIAEQAGVIISKNADGSISYHFEKSERKVFKNVAYNTISTPRGGKYQVRLPDGTQVWLNAASTLRFPASFAGLGVRNVELTGEAYFEVAKDPMHPFEVGTNNQNIQVLGTHFNVNAYADEPDYQTTLLEGSISLFSTLEHNSPIHILKPGEQAVSKGQITHVRKADTDHVLDWKNDEFYFKDMDFKTAMRTIARWYDIEVIYAPGVDTSFEPGGWISRNSSISSVLKMMESTGAVHFKAEGRRITVTK